MVLDMLWKITKPDSGADRAAYSVCFKCAVLENDNKENIGMLIRCFSMVGI